MGPLHHRTTTRLSKFMKMAAMPLLFLLLTAVVRGQSALDGFDPNANGTVRVVVAQPDGKILLGGDFTTLSPNGGVAVIRNHIARLNPDGTLDTAFDPNANEIVYSIAVQADGKILAGGSFFGVNSIGGQTRNYIARLDATTGLADSFNPSASDFVQTIAVQADGKILVGGLFARIGGQTRSCIARLDPTTGLVDSFNPSASNLVYSIAVQADGKILAVGSFFGANSIGGQTRNYIARLDAATGLADSFDPNANSDVYSIATQADGKILAGGAFTTIGGQTRNSIARLDATTGLADSFNPSANIRVMSIVVQSDGKILAGGSFVNIGGQTRHRIARLDATTGLADSFDPNANGDVRSIAVQADGRILAGGAFNGPNSIGGQTRNCIARLETDGRLDQTLDLGAVGSYVLATAVQPDGKIVIGGLFNTVLGVARNNLARLNTDGTLDTTFDPNANDLVVSIAVQADGKILAGGNFTSIGGQTRHFIARLDATTGLADMFDPNATGGVFSIAVQADGKILAGGRFTSIGGQARRSIARLDATTGLADSFDPNPSGFYNYVYAIAVQADGKILVGGGFTNIGGQMRNRIARLDAGSGLADSFDANASSWVFSITVQTDGKILAAGRFNGANSIGGQTRNYIARLDATTGLADSFNPNANNEVRPIAVQADGKILISGLFTNVGGQTRDVARLDATTGLADSFDPNANGAALSIAVQADGKILIGGSFTTIGGQTRSLFARFSNDTAALQNLAVTQTTITWTRGGSSPQFTRVTFEYSNDNVNYTPLGNGTSSGSNWTLTGLSLPTGVNIYIRARGYYRSGDSNGSESITESVRNAFLTAPPPTPTPTSTLTPTPTPNPTPTPALTPTPTPTPVSSPTPPTPTPTPGCTDDTWTATSLTNVPAKRTNHVAVWTGSEMIVWGGSDGSLWNTGGRYNPGTDSWAATSTTNAPPGRAYYTAVWTGSEMIVWGGDFNGNFPTGGRYNPTTDSWAAMSTTNAPTGRAYYTAVWTGSEMIVWGGVSSGNQLNTGGRYNPSTDSWTATSITNAPTGRDNHTAVWTGSEMIVWGGQRGGDLNTGGRYNSSTDSWTSTNTINTPTGRAYHTAVWTGTEMIAWGGEFNGFTSVNTGGRYNPGTDSWTATSTINPPSARDFHTAVWTGSEMIVWGGYSGCCDIAFNTGGRYNPDTDSWTATDTINAPTARGSQTAVWTGSEMIVWGGSTNGPGAWNTGGRYCAQPPTPAPTPTPTATATATATAAPTPTPSLTPAATATATATPTATATATPTATAAATPTATPAASPTSSPAATPTPSPTPASQAINLSTRMRVQAGDNVGIGGFIITGTAPKHVLLRGIGPSLTGSGVPDALADPVLELHGPGAFVTITNDNWRDDPVQAALILADGIPPTNDPESAIDATLTPGAYTAVVRGKNNTSGVALVEVYDLSQAVLSKLANISTRAFVSTGNNIVIAGFMLGHNSGVDRIVARGIGPSLTAFGVPDALADPTLELRDSNGTLLSANNNWQDNAVQAAELTAAGLAPTNNLEAAIATTLPPGLYTALLAGLNNGTGVGLVEVYDLGAP
jgi:uncharacterized delta-60 repeat protein